MSDLDDISSPSPDLAVNEVIHDVMMSLGWLLPRTMMEVAQAEDHFASTLGVIPATGSANLSPQTDDENGDEPGKLRASLRGHTARITSISWSPDGRLIASSAKDGSLRIWDTVTGVLLRSYSNFAKPITSIAWARGNGAICYGMEDGTTWLWDEKSMRVPYPFSRGWHDGAIISLAWSSDGHRVASSGRDNVICIGDASTRQLIRRIDLQIATDSSWSCRQACSMSWSPDDHWLVIGTDSGTVELHDIRNETESRNLYEHSGDVNCVAWSPDGQRIVSTSSDKQVVVWNLRRGYEQRFPDRASIVDAAFESGGRLLATIDRLGFVQVRRCDTWGLVARLSEPVFGRTITTPSLAFHPKHARLATLGEQQLVIHIWDLCVAESISLRAS